MLEVKGNLWSYRGATNWAAVTTNGVVKTTGKAVMGSGVALQAKKMFRGIDRRIGAHIRENGNVPIVLPMYRIVTWPVKHNWWEQADIELLLTSYRHILMQLSKVWAPAKLYAPHPGCGNGGLDWDKQVKQVLEKEEQSDRIVFVDSREL